MKNDIFNFRRFGKYFATDIRTCWANYGLSLLTITIVTPMALYLISTAFNLLIRSSWDGPDLGLRVFVFGIAMFCLVVTMPVKCYGKITEKQYGSFWLTLPASRLEKFLSMVLMTCIIVPVTGTAVYLGIDSLICLADKTCGTGLAAGAVELIRNMGDLGEMTINLADESLTIEDAAIVHEVMKEINNPWMYVDEIFGITLPFLLGAVYFKSGKTAKTIIAMFVFSTAVSIVLTPFLGNWASEVVSAANNDVNQVIEIFNNSLFKNLVLIDTVSDTVFNLAFLTGIWFRIKTLKH